MPRAAILTTTDTFGDAFVVICREGVILAELDPWWTQISDRFGIVLRSANDDYRLATSRS